MNKSASTTITDTTEIKTIKTIKSLIFVIFALFIFEGPLRKWIFPSYNKYLFFIRDPFILIVYLLSLKVKIYEHFSPLVYIGVAFSFVCGLLIAFQISRSQLPLILFLYGWRNYFLPIPLAGIIGVIFTKNDLAKIVKFIFYISIPSFFICYFQSISPAGHWLNAGLGKGADIFTSFGVTRGFIRPPGLFTISFGHGLFLTSIFVFLIGIYTDNEFKLFKLTSRKYYTIFIFAIFSLVISGQRGTFISIAFVTFSAFFLSLFSHRKKAKDFIKYCLIMSTLLLCSSIIFSSHLGALWERVQTASQTASQNSDIIGYDLVERIVGNAQMFTHQLDLPIPSLGYGIGFGGNGADRLINRASFTKLHLQMEDEWSRHIIELGPTIGILFIGFRIFTCISLGLLSFYISVKQQKIMPFIIFSSIASLIFYVQLTGNGLASGHVWFYVGITLSLCKSQDKEFAK